MIEISEYEYGKIADLQDAACEQILRQWADENGYAGASIEDLLIAYATTAQEVEDLKGEYIGITS